MKTQKDFNPNIYTGGLKHAARGPHVAREGILCGPGCSMGIFK